MVVGDQASQFKLDTPYRATLRGQSKAWTFYNSVIRYDKDKMHDRLLKLIPDLDKEKHTPGKTIVRLCRCRHNAKCQLA